MLETLTVDRLIADIFTIGRETIGVDEFFERAGNRLREALGLEKVAIKDTYQDRASLTGLEEYVTNTGKPYLDNRLSGYSAFPELINQYNLGFRSCLILPVSVEGKLAVMVTLLSKQEDKFDGKATALISLASYALAYQGVAKIEKERSLSLARYFDAAFSTYVPQLLIDKNGAIVKANKSVTGLFTKTQREMLGRNVGEFFEIDANMLGALASGSVAEIRDKFDAGRIYRVSSSRVSEKLLHVLLFDATDLKELEEKVRLSERSSNDLALLLAKDTTILWAGTNADRVIKMGKDELVGKRLIDLAYADKEFVGALEMINESYSKSLRIGVGNDVFVDTKATLFRNRFGGFSCVLSSNNMEKYLMSMRNAVEQLVDYSSDAIISVDSLGYIKSMNKSAERLLKYKTGEVAGSALTSLYADAESQQKTSSSLSLVKNRGAIENVFVNVRAKDGAEPLPCEQAIRSVIDADNDTTGYMVVIKELATKRKMEELEESLEDMEKQLQNKAAESELKTQFIYNISHDLKTPLTNIKGFGKLLLEGNEKLSEEHKEYIRIITHETDRLFQLIQQILDVAKLSSGKIKLDVQQVNLNELMKNPTIDTLVEVAKNKGLEFGMVVDYNVPMVQADPNRLIQVLVNLIGNAIKFTDKGGINVRILRKGRNVRIEVTDTGVGISKEDKIKLFKKFYQLQRKGLTVQEGSGTGLGLAIAKEIVNLHGGRINVISEPGKGSTFWFTIPISGRTRKAAK